MSEIEVIRHHQPYSDGIILLRPVTEYDKEAYYQLLDKGSRNGRSKNSAHERSAVKIAKSAQ